MANTFQDLSCIVQGLRVAYRVWNPQASIKVVALHGWLDNAGSFSSIGEQLPSNISLIAIDLPGQGFSQHRPESGTYHLWDDLLTLELLFEELGLEKIYLLGHSRGAMLSTLYASAKPERVKHITLIDGLLPIPVEIEKTPLQLKRFLDEYSKEKAPRFFDSRDKAVEARAKAGGIEPVLAEQLAERQLQQSDDGWFWHVDERLKFASAVKMTAEHNKSVLSALACKVDVFIASNGFSRYYDIEDIKKGYGHFNWKSVDGHHHFHMTEAGASLIASAISESVSE